MKLSWLLTLLLLVVVAVFSVQNADIITVHFAIWQVPISAALAIQIAAMLGALVGLVVGARSRTTTRAARSAPAADSREHTTSSDRDRAAETRAQDAQLDLMPRA